MVIKIKVEKIMTKDGEKKINLRVSGILDAYELPKEYLEGVPRVVCEHRYRSLPTTIVSETGETHSYYMGNSENFSPSQAEEVIRIIQAAGERLHKINQRIERERAMYAGVSEIEI